LEPCYKTFVSIGNGKQYFSRLLNAVEQNISHLPHPVLIQCGHTPFVSQQGTVVDFVNMDDFLLHVAQAEVLILHAGAGSVLNAIKAGKRPIVMPRIAKWDEVVNDHQIPLAKMLHEEGKVWMVENADQLQTAIIKTRIEGSNVQAHHQVSRGFEIIKKKLAEVLA